MRYETYRTAAEIGVFFNIPESNVENVISTAICKIRQTEIGKEIMMALFGEVSKKVFDRLMRHGDVFNKLKSESKNYKKAILIENIFGSDPRVSQALKERGFRSLQDFSGFSISELKKARNIGDVTINKLIDTCKKYNISLLDDVKGTVDMGNWCIFNVIDRGLAGGCIDVGDILKGINAVFIRTTLYYSSYRNKLLHQCAPLSKKSKRRFLRNELEVLLIKSASETISIEHCISFIINKGRRFEFMAILDLYISTFDSSYALSWFKVV